MDKGNCNPAHHVGEGCIAEAAPAVLFVKIVKRFYSEFAHPSYNPDSEAKTWYPNNHHPKQGSESSTYSVKLPELSYTKQKGKKHPQFEGFFWNSVSSSVGDINNFSIKAEVPYGLGAQDNQAMIN